ncbi:MAG: hypothetical protein H0T60_08675 [Acidobacteria bacterium]|nr:hypothetical protein [Acidobacteriota bacterium]
MKTNSTSMKRTVTNAQASVWQPSATQHGAARRGDHCLSYIPSDSLGGVNFQAISGRPESVLLVVGRYNLN